MEQDVQDFIGPLRPEAGHEFTFTDSSVQPLPKVRTEIRVRLGREPHIKARVGPFTVHENKLSAPLEAIDDPFLDGKFSVDLTNIPLGGCIYFGVLK